MAGLREAVEEAVVATVGPPRVRPPREPSISVAPISTDWVDLTAAIQTICRIRTNLDALARETPPSTRASYAAEAEIASRRIAAWVAAMEDVDVQVA